MIHYYVVKEQLELEGPDATHNVRAKQRLVSHFSWGYMGAGAAAVESAMEDLVHAFNKGAIDAYSWTHFFGTPADVVDFVTDLRLTNDVLPVEDYVLEAFRKAGFGRPARSHFDLANCLMSTMFSQSLPAWTTIESPSEGSSAFLN